MSFGAFAILLVLVGCTSPRSKVSENAWNAEADQSFNVSVVFFKFRKQQVHLSLQFLNMYADQTVKAIGQGVILEYDGVKGQLSRDTTPDYPVGPGLKRKILFKYNFATAPEPGKLAKVRVPVQKEDGTSLGACEFTFTPS
jgi:hypothetical protein